MCETVALVALAVVVVESVVEVGAAGLVTVLGIPEAGKGAGLTRM